MVSCSFLLCNECYKINEIIFPIYTELIQCPELRIDNGGVTVIPNSRTLNSSATYSCSDGYSLQGNSERICQMDSTWSGSDPVCGETIIYPLPMCCYTKHNVPWYTELIQCPMLTIENGEVVISTNDRTVNSSATYSCSDGYSLQGNSERFCQMDGTWSDTNPSCGNALIFLLSHDSKQDMSMHAGA